MDVIASTAFGLKIDSQKDKNNQFVTMAKKLFDRSLANPFLLIAGKYTRIFDDNTKTNFERKHGQNFDKKLSSLTLSINFQLHVCFILQFSSLSFCLS